MTCVPDPPTQNTTSRFGAFLDPVADKLMVASLLVLLSTQPIPSGICLMPLLSFASLLLVLSSRPILSNSLLFCFPLLASPADYPTREHTSLFVAPCLWLQRMHLQKEVCLLGLTKRSVFVGEWPRESCSGRLTFSFSL